MLWVVWTPGPSNGPSWASAKSGCLGISPPTASRNSTAMKTVARRSRLTMVPQAGKPLSNPISFNSAHPITQKTSPQIAFYHRFHPVPSSSFSPLTRPTHPLHAPPPKRRIPIKW